VVKLQFRLPIRNDSDNSIFRRNLKNFLRNNSHGISAHQATAIGDTAQIFELQDFHYSKQLGEGSFGTVVVAIHRGTGTIYAAKRVWKRVSGSSNPKAKKKLLAEKKTVGKLSHVSSPMVRV
jgi:serine/threonine protein kinase